MMKREEKCAGAFLPPLLCSDAAFGCLHLGQNTVWSIRKLGPKTRKDFYSPSTFMYRDLHDIWDYNLDCKQREQRDISFVLFTRFIQETLVIQSFKHQEVRIINKNVKRAKVSWHVSRTSANNLGASQNDTDNCIQQNNRVNEGWSQNGLIPEERWRKRKIHSPMHFHIGSPLEGAKNWPTWLPLKGNISKSNIVSSGAARASE